jgi:hypothetical protein
MRSVRRDSNPHCSGSEPDASSSWAHVPGRFETVLGDAPSASEFAAPSQLWLVTAGPGGSEGDRTLISRMRAECSPVELHPQGRRKRQESNLQGCHARPGSGRVPSPVGLRFHVIAIWLSKTGHRPPAPRTSAAGQTCRDRRRREDTRAAPWGQKDSNPRAGGLQPRQPSVAYPRNEEEPPEVAWGGSISRTSQVGYMAAPRCSPRTWISRDRSPAG